MLFDTVVMVLKLEIQRK